MKYTYEWFSPVHETSPEDHKPCVILASYDSDTGLFTIEDPEEGNSFSLARYEVDALCRFFDMVREEQDIEDEKDELLSGCDLEDCEID